ncbi:MAG: hypothetical protein NW208_15100 [Bryobacter sp.]|nr:hypothetical protein [Bryobacter sp.]
MAKQKSVGKEELPPLQTAPTGLYVPPPKLTFPSAWLLALVMAILCPWAAFLAWSFSTNRASAIGNAVSGGANTVQSVRNSAAGPWGRLETTPVVISPPQEFISSDWGPANPDRWHFPQTSRNQIFDFLLSAGLDPATARQLADAASPDPAKSGHIVRPPASVVENLSPQVRANLYVQLGVLPQNSSQYAAYRHFGKSAQDWLGNSRLAPETLRIVEPLVYSWKEFLYFADIDLVRRKLGEGPELQKLAKALFRESTFLVRVHIDDIEQADKVASYWGLGGRRTDIRPLLESVAAAGPNSSIDIGHLLPPLARDLLYRYPKLALGDFYKPGLKNCFWTALNFFATTPNDRYLNPQLAIEDLKRDYYIVQDNYQLGDIVALADPDDTIYHTSVYLAQDLVFGKNGLSPLAPWTIVPLSRLRGYYPDPMGGHNTTFYRRKDF